MQKHLQLTVVALLLSTFIFAQEAAKKEEAPAKLWTRTAGIGLDAGQLAIINPRVGAGENRINIGGAANVALNYKKGRIAWDNAAAAIFGVQKLGSGIVAGTAGTSKPFQKSTDELRINSKFGYGLKTGSKWFIAGDFSALTQITPTYKNNLLTDINNKGIEDVVSQFFSPAILTLAVGIDYKPMPKVSFFYSPISFRGVIVQNDDIAARGVNGTKVNVFGVSTNKNALYDLGSMARAIYTDKFLKDKLVINSNLGLFGAYQSGKGIKVDWANQLAWALGKGFQIGLNVNVLYDKNILVQVSDKNSVNGIKVDSNGNAVLVNDRPSVIQQLLFKYAKTF